MSESTKPTENTAENGNKSKPLLQAVFFAPYLPYSVKIAYDYFGDTQEIATLIGVEDRNGETRLQIDTGGSALLKYCKIALRPLSDFYDINAPAFIDTNFDIPTQLVLVDLCSKKQHYSGVRYSDMQEFLREHIDIFNLIEQDLAVSIHDVV